MRNISAVLLLAISVLAAQPHIANASSMMMMSEMESDMSCDSSGKSEMKECCDLSAADNFVVSQTTKLTPPSERTAGASEIPSRPFKTSSITRGESTPEQSFHFLSCCAPLLL